MWPHRDDLCTTAGLPRQRQLANGYFSKKFAPGTHLQFVLLGEASHGTHDFYQTRADITHMLVKERGFSAGKPVTWLLCPFEDIWWILCVLNLSLTHL